MENQELAKIIEGLKEAKLIYNDADFCRKTGIQPSFLSEMKSGRKPFTTKSRRIVEETFPDFFRPKTVELHGDTPTLGEVARMLADHDQRFHAQMERIMDAIGVPKPKEKTA